MSSATLSKFISSIFDALARMCRVDVKSLICLHHRLLRLYDKTYLYAKLGVSAFIMSIGWMHQGNGA